MLIWQEDPNLFLVELSDLRQDTPPERIAGHVEPLRQIVSWAEEYLCKPHPELGREGPVCPYVLPSMKRGVFFLTVCPGRDFDQPAVQERITRYREWFLQLPPQSGNEAGLKTILVLFPDLAQEDVPALIDATQEKLKPSYVEKGLMIGEFHAGPPAKAGLWNADFRPLRSPVPMLVIRFMVPTDFAFLREEKPLLQAYLDRYGDSVPAHIRNEVKAVADRFGIPFGRLEDMEVVHPRVREALEQKKVWVRVRRHADQEVPIRGPRDFAQALGYSAARITKSLFLRCQCHDSYVVLVCPALQRVDLPRVAEHLGCKRLELATVQELEALLGFSPGGVSPIGIEGIRVLIDEQLLAHPTVLVAGGEVAVEIEIDPRKLVEVTGAETLTMALGTGIESGAGAEAGTEV